MIKMKTKLPFKIMVFLLILFTYNISYSTTDTFSLLTNGDFSTGLVGWKEIRIGTANIMKLGVVKDSLEYPHVLEFRRVGAKKIRGKLGVSQLLNKDVSTYNSLVIKVDVKVIYSSLISDRFRGGAYPVTIEIEYITEDNLTAFFKRGFLYVERIKYKKIGKRIPQNQWYSYTSENLLELTPKPKMITRVMVYGDGFEFWARVANIQLIGSSIPKKELTKVEEKIKEESEKDIPEIKEEEKPLISKEEIKEPLITNVFIDTDIRQALRDIAAQAQVTIIPDDSVQGVISIELKDVPLEKALKMLLLTGGYVFKKIEDYYLIGSPHPDNPTFPLLASVERVKLNYLKVENISNLLLETYSKYIRVDKKENILIITAPPNIIEEIKAYIKKIDVPPKQILIETVVTELSREARKELGIDWGAGGGTGRVKLETDLTLHGAYVSGGVSSHAMATIKMLVERGKAKIRANPRVLTLDGKSANIHIGREEYHPLPGTAYQPPRFDKISSGITLTITPYIGGDDEITVEIAPEVSDVSAIGKEGYPIISKRTVKTTVNVKNGNTIVIGGLIQQKEENRLSKIPVLGSIPILNLLFRKTRLDTSETEIVIFITPHII